jgi:hypothetical protein
MKFRNLICIHMLRVFEAGGSSSLALTNRAHAWRDRAQLGIGICDRLQHRHRFGLSQLKWRAVLHGYDDPAAPLVLIIWMGSDCRSPPDTSILRLHAHRSKRRCRAGT